MNASNGWTLGAEAPWGQASFGLNYTRMQYEGSGGAKAQLDKWALGASYALSKRTKLYGGLARSGGSVKSHIQQAQVLQAGLRAAF